MNKDYKILTVDNDEALLRLLSSELTNEGYTVTTANDGEEAVNLIQSMKFDLVFLDINMPIMNGFDVLKFIKAKYPFIKVVILTGYCDVVTALKSKKLRADDFLGKPYDITELFTAIERLCTN